MHPRTQAIARSLVPRPYAIGIGLIGTLLSSAPLAAAQSPPDPTIPAHERLDPGLSDINPLQTSLRALPMDMRQDTAFEHVYQSPLDPNQRFRVAGGLYAVFSTSDYVMTPAGQVPVYPAGVRFHIGPPPGFRGNPLDPATEAMLRHTDPSLALEPGSAVAMDREPSTRRRPEVVRLPAAIPTISSEAFRQHRLRAMTARALERAGLGAPGAQSSD